VGDTSKVSYAGEILRRALVADGQPAQIKYMGVIPTTRLEMLMQTGEISAAILGETAERNGKFLSVKIPMTDNLMGKRILFIPKGAQKDYDGVKTLSDFQKLGKAAGMGKAWADVGIWEKNGLKVLPQAGDWKVLYRMVEAGNRNVDYLPRGAMEMIEEMAQFPSLDVEKGLVLVYDKDQVLYVTPKDPGLRDQLEKSLKKALSTGLIKKTVAEFYHEVFEPPLDIDQRVQIRLTLP